MASNRHLGRIVTMQTLYEEEFRSACGDKKLDFEEILKRNIERYGKTLDDTSFVRELTRGVRSKQTELDGLLQPLAPEWPFDQISRIDRAILRIGAFELINRQNNVPPKVVINEAVELAKAFGGDNSSKFINGVLGSLLRQLEARNASKKDAEAAKDSKDKVE